MNEQNFAKTIKSLDELLPITVESKHSAEFKSGVWNSETISSVDYIPADAPENYKIYKRLYNAFINRRAIFETLYFQAGGVDTQRYLDAMREIERNIKLLEKHYHTKAVSLVVVNQKDTEKIRNILFEDISICDFYARTVLGVTVDDIYAKNLPDHLRGTMIFEQEWHASKDTIISNYPTPNNIEAKPPTTTGSI